MGGTGSIPRTLLAIHKCIEYMEKPPLDSYILASLLHYSHVLWQIGFPMSVGILKLKFRTEIERLTKCTVTLLSQSRGYQSKCFGLGF